MIRYLNIYNRMTDSAEIASRNIIFKQPKVLSDIYVLDNVLGYAVLFYIGDEAYAV